MIGILRPKDREGDLTTPGIIFSSWQNLPNAEMLTKLEKNLDVRYVVLFFNEGLISKCGQEF